MCQQQISTRIETDRLVLRLPQMSDAAHIAGLIDREAARMTAGMPYPCSVDTAEAFIARMQGSLDDKPLLIEHRQAGPVGLTGFHRAHRPYFELGFWLGAAFRGLGVAAEAVSAAMIWARDGWGWRVVSSGHFVDNPASARVLDKAGFLYTGVVEAQYSLGREQQVDTRLMIWLA
jgi:RimJ/RimL family protein N-acetyltransferase